MRSFAYTIMEPIKRELEQNYNQLLAALEEEKNLGKFIKDWNYVEIAVELFPQHTDKLFNFVFNNPKEFLKYTGSIENAVKHFPHYSDKLFEYVLNNHEQLLDSTGAMKHIAELFPQYADNLFKCVLNKSNELLSNWGEIKGAREAFPSPQHTDTLRDYVFKNRDKFLNNIFVLKCAIEAFPQNANMLQEQRVKAVNLHTTDAVRAAIVADAHAAVRKYLLLKDSHAEIRKNACMAAQGSEQKGQGFMFFRNLPDEIGVEIAALTGISGAHTMEQAEQIAQENYSRPTLGKRKKDGE